MYGEKKHITTLEIKLKINQILFSIKNGFYKTTRDQTG
jgi:hypothetical protein